MAGMNLEQAGLCPSASLNLQYLNLQPPIVGSISRTTVDERGESEAGSDNDEDSVNSADSIDQDQEPAAVDRSALQAAVETRLRLLSAQTTQSSSAVSPLALHRQRERSLRERCMPIVSSMSRVILCMLINIVPVN